MQIKLPHMPYKFDSPEGRMEITVRSGPSPIKGDKGLQFSAAASFLQAGPLALKRIPLAAHADTYRGVMQTLIGGFTVTPASHDEHSVEFRVLTALINGTGVVDVDN